MMWRTTRLAVAVGAAGLLAMGSTIGPAVAQKRGGTLDFVVGSKIPSYDGHVETTFGMIHPIRPFYSLLIRVNPDNPGSPTDFVCDLCVGDVPTPTDGGKTFTFKIAKGVKFHDGTPLTSKDVLATFNKIIFPPPGIPSSRKAFFAMVDSITAPDDETVVFKLKFPSGSFLPSLAMPFNFVYSKKDLDTHGYRWHRDHINGTGAFKFVEHQPGHLCAASGTTVTTTRASRTSTGSTRSRRRKCLCACRPSVGIGQPSSSVVSRRRRVTILSGHWATRSRSRKPTGTARCSSRRTTS